MNEALLESIPSHNRADALAGCAAVFGNADIKSLQRITGGLSAQTFKLEVKDRFYLLRIDPAPNPLRNLQRSYTCMQSAEAAGLAPPVHYADAVKGVAIMDFIDAKPFTSHPGGNDGLLRDLAALVVQLQATPVFPPLANYFVMIKRMLDMVSSSLFAPGLLDAHIAAFERIHAAYPWASVSPVSSHNDPNPRNILFDGNRLWLIDWETAFCNDPLVDIAIIANNFATTPETETILLQAWLGSVPSAPLRARLLLMRLVTHLYYACILLIVFAGKPDPTKVTTVDAMTPEQIKLAFAQGKLKAGTLEAIVAIANIFLKAFADGIKLPQFEPALVAVQT